MPPPPPPRALSLSLSLSLSLLPHRQRASRAQPCTRARTVLLCLGATAKADEALFENWSLSLSLSLACLLACTHGVWAQGMESPTPCALVLRHCTHALSLSLFLSFRRPGEGVSPLACTPARFGVERSVAENKKGLLRQCLKRRVESRSNATRKRSFQCPQEYSPPSLLRSPVLQSSPKWTRLTPMQC